MANSRKRGFTVIQSTQDSFFDLFAKLCEDWLIP